MTEANGEGPANEAAAAEAAAPAPAPKKTRKRAAPKPAPTAAPEPPPAAKPAPAAPTPLNDVIMAQTAENLAELSANLTAAMTRANQVFSTAFIDQSTDAAKWQPDPLGMQGALNDVWSHLARQPETLRDAHARLW